MLSDILPSVTATMMTPKAQELVANPYRHGGKNARIPRIDADAGADRRLAQVDWADFGCDNRTQPL